MPKKGKKGKGKVVELGTHGYTLECLAENFLACSKAIDLPLNQAKEQAGMIGEQMEPTDSVPIPNKLSFKDHYLGPGGARALVCAIRGEGPGVSDKKAGKDKKNDKEKAGAEVPLKEVPAYAVPHPEATSFTLPLIGLPSSKQACDWATFTRPLDPALDDLFNVAFREPNLGPNNYRALTEVEFVESGLTDAGAFEVSRLLSWQAVLHCGVELSSLTIRGDSIGLRACEAMGAALGWGLCAPGNFKSELGDGALSSAPEKRPVSLQADFEKSKERLANIKLVKGQIDDRLGRAADWKVSRAELQVGISKRSRTLVASSPLLRLSLSHLPTLDDDCVRVLCHGLARNGTLQDLDLSFCGFGGGAAPFLGRLLAAEESKLKKLTVAGNFIGPDGLRGLTYPGVEMARSLETLDLTACGIGRPPFKRTKEANEQANQELKKAWDYFVSSLSTNAFEEDPGAPPRPAPPAKGKKGKKKKGGGDELPPGSRVRITRLILLENDITVEQAAALEAERFPGTALKVLKVDTTLPDDVFVRLWRDEDGGKGGGKKGKKKKK